MATHSSILAWRIPGTAGPGGLPSVGSYRVGHDWSNLAAAAEYIKEVSRDEKHNIWIKKKTLDGVHSRLDAAEGKVNGLEERNGNNSTSSPERVTRKGSSEGGPVRGCRAPSRCDPAVPAGGMGWRGAGKECEKATAKQFLSLMKMKTQKSRKTWRKPYKAQHKSNCWKPLHEPRSSRCISWI